LYLENLRQPHPRDDDPPGGRRRGPIEPLHDSRKTMRVNLLLTESPEPLPILKRRHGHWPEDDFDCSSSGRRAKASRGEWHHVGS
jgi:hypothetical protein